MKHKSTLYTLAFCSLVLASCSDNDIDKGGAVPAGTEIQFGTSLTTNPDSRTYYDPDDVANANAEYWRIYWNYQADDLDKIFIYSPEANAGVNQATYTVDPEGQNKYQATSVTKDGAAGIQTSDAASYRFFSLFPASAVTGTATGNTITANFKGQQNPTKVVKTDNVYTLEADMDNCLMTASSTIAAADIAKGVGLQFKPFSTVLNIEVNGPTTGSATATITSVLVSSTSQISGDFSIDFSGTEPKCTANSDADADKRIYVSTLTESGDGVQLNAGEKLNVRVFLLPNTNVNNLTVQVNGNVKQSSSQAAVSGSWKKSLTMGSFQPSQIHTCRLPEISSAVTEFDKSIWLSQLDPRTYISEISLPGSALSWNSADYVTIAEPYQTQSKTIAEQFNAGIRVFQAHCWLGEGTSQVDGGTPLHLIAAYPNGTQDTNRQLYDAVKVLTDEMKANHANEFCVLMLSDYLTTSAYGSWDIFYKRVRALSEHMASMELLAENVNANTTINDVKGKVILKIQLNNSAQNYWTDLNGSRTLLNTYGDGADRNVWYSQLTFGTASIAAGGTNASSSVATWPMSFIYTEQANPSNFFNVVQNQFLTAMSNNVGRFRQYYNASEHKIFGMTYLGGTGFSGNMINHSAADVTEAYINRWNTAIQSGFDNTPYGWVMFNQVGGTNTTINTAVERVINHNMRTLQRQAAPSKYTGSAGAANGGQLND